MAAGDFVDAELRLKEFLLQYPDYPGAHVNLAIIHATMATMRPHRQQWTRHWRWTPIIRPH